MGRRYAKKHYTARWGLPGRPSIANVSFEASHDIDAKRRANKIARELHVENTPRSITCGGRVVEVLDTGISR